MEVALAHMFHSSALLAAGSKLIEPIAGMVVKSIPVGAACNVAGLIYGDRPIGTTTPGEGVVTHAPNQIVFVAPYCI
jgi:hypothetical protein